MTDFRCQGRSYQLMIDRLIEVLFGQLFSWRGNTAAHKGRMENRVDFIKSQPILDLILVASKNRADIALVETNQIAVGPAIVLTR